MTGEPSTAYSHANRERIGSATEVLLEGWLKEVVERRNEKVERERVTEKKKKKNPSKNRKRTRVVVKVDAGVNRSVHGVQDSAADARVLG